MDSLKSKLVHNVRLAQQLKDSGAVESGVQQVWGQYASFSAEREKEAEMSLARLKSLMLPPVQQYFIQAAEKGSGLCNPLTYASENNKEEDKACDTIFRQAEEYV